MQALLLLPARLDMVVDGVRGHWRTNPQGEGISQNKDHTRLVKAALRHSLPQEGVSTSSPPIQHLQTALWFPIINIIIFLLIYQSVKYTI